MREKVLEKIRQDVVTTGLELARSGMIIGTYGNISCRIDKNSIAITPSGRNYELLKPADIVVTDLGGQVIINNKGLMPSSELLLHLEIYKKFTDARAVVHTHSLYASALAVSHRDLPPVMEDLAQLTGGTVRCTDYTIAGTKKLAEKAVEAMEGGRHAALLANHGAVCWGRNLKEALTTAQILEKGAHIYYVAYGFGKPFPLNEKTVKELHDFYMDHYSKRQQGEE